MANKTITLTATGNFHRHIDWTLTVNAERLFKVEDGTHVLMLTHAEAVALTAKGCHATGCMCGEHMPDHMAHPNGGIVLLDHEI